MSTAVASTASKLLDDSDDDNDNPTVAADAKALKEEMAGTSRAPQAAAGMDPTSMAVNGANGAVTVKTETVPNAAGAAAAGANPAVVKQEPQAGGVHPQAFPMQQNVGMPVMGNMSGVAPGVSAPLTGNAPMTQGMQAGSVPMVQGSMPVSSMPMTGTAGLPATQLMGLPGTVPGSQMMQNPMMPAAGGIPGVTQAASLGVGAGGMMSNNVAGGGAVVGMQQLPGQPGQTMQLASGQVMPNQQAMGGAMPAAGVDAAGQQQNAAAPTAAGPNGPAAAGSQSSNAGQSTRRIQVADILNLLHRAVTPEKWTKISAVVNQIKESTKSSGANDTDSKRKLLQSIRDIAGIDLWNKVVMVLHQSGSQAGGSAVGTPRSGLSREEQMRQLTAAAQAQGITVDELVRRRRAQNAAAQQQKLSSGDAKGAAPSGSSRPQPTVGQVIHAVKVFVKKEDHQQLEQLQEQYLSRIIDKKQLEQKLRAVAGDSALRQAIASLFPRGGGPGQAAKDNSTEAKALVAHAYKCRDNQCQYGKKCFDTKLKLQQLARHAQQCNQSQNNSSSNASTQCRLCRMWKYVQQMRYSSGGGSMPATRGGGASGTGAVRIREADPAVLRRLALEHMSKCNGCEKCNRLREKMRAQQSLKHGSSRSGRQPPAKRRKTVGGRESKSSRSIQPVVEEPVRNHREIMQREAPDVIEEGERVEVLTPGSEKSRNGPIFRTAKILECDHDKNEMTIQFSGTIGTAFAIAGYDKISMDSPQLRKYIQIGSSAPPVEEGVFKPGFFCEVQTRNRSGNVTWSAGEVQAMSRDGRYSVELAEQGGLQVSSTREEMRAVCNHQHCRRRNLVLELPQLYCIKCKTALRLPGACYYQEGDEAATSRGGGRGVQLCHLCYCDVRGKGKQKGAAALWRTIGREREFDFDAFLEVRVPRQGGVLTNKHLKEECAPFVECNDCGRWYHWVCALYNDVDMQMKRWQCSICREKDNLSIIQVKPEHTAQALPETKLSKAIQETVKQMLRDEGVQHSPIAVRVVSQMVTSSPANPEMVAFDWKDGEPYCKEFPYTSTAVMAFQVIDGHEVCLFAMYTQEYGGDCPEPNKWHLYISYLDSVRYFESRPANKRTSLYHAILSGYLKFMRERGFRFIHIWVEPPKQGDEYIFFSRPLKERQPMQRDKLRGWYERMLQTCKAQGIVDDYGSMLDYYRNITSVRQIPCFHGDLIETTLAGVFEKEKQAALAKTSFLDGPGVPVQMDSQHVLAKAQEELKVIDGLFLVARMRPLAFGEELDTEPNPLVLNAATNFREAFVGKSQTLHWQFNTLHWAKYSTMMLTHCLHTSPKPTYCLPNCKRGRAEDDSFMICCDQCEQWYHGECVGVSKMEADAMGRYLCMACMEGGDDGGLGELQGALGM